MPLTATTQPATKAAERARLSTLFDRLASRKPHGLPTTKHQGATSRDGSDPTPQEVNSVLKNLYGLVHAKAAHRTTVAWPSKTSQVEAMAVDEDDSTDEEGEPSERFPLANEKKYPFTFKHMIHKLYKKDEWEKTVKEMLEKSKRDYKPLAEAGMSGVPPGLERTAQDEIEALRGRRVGDYSRRTSGGAMVYQTVRSSRMGAELKYATRRRSQSVTQSLKKTLVSPTSPTFDIPPTSPTWSQGNSMRAVKKRCVGKRKSMSGIHTQNENSLSGIQDGFTTHGGTWVFESAISTTEHYIPGIYSPRPSPPESPVEGAFSAPKRRALVETQIEFVAPTSFQQAMSTERKERATIKRRSLTVDTQLAKNHGV